MLTVQLLSVIRAVMTDTLFLFCLPFKNHIQTHTRARVRAVDFFTLKGPRREVADNCSPLCPLRVDAQSLSLLAADHEGWCKECLNSCGSQLTPVTCQDS